jgi:hypothetical protein
LRFVFAANRLPLLVAAGVLAAAAAAAQQSEIRVERVRFAQGASSAVVEGSITGYEIVDYVLGAREGQQMNVSMATDNGANYFNLLAPGESEVAMFNGSVGENQFEGVLAESGDYKVRLYLMRSAARRKEVAQYRLEMIIGAGQTPGSAGEPSAEDVLVEGTGYHATGSLPCSMGGGQPTGSCPFGVTRSGNGSGTVTVTRTDGRSRAIFFEDSRATGCDASQADPGAFSASREGDLSIIRIGDERYEIPDAVIQGG